VEELRNPTSQIRTQQSVEPGEYALRQILNALQGIRFGSVNIIVQDGVIIQIDRTEKTRIRTGSCSG
jgi:hypothetical protein